MTIFTDIHVFTDINVSSSGHYFAEVRYRWNGRNIGRDYCLTEGFLTEIGTFWKQAPAYLYREVCRQLAKAMQDGSARYFEYDREGHKRYENLRYFDADHAKWLAEQMVKEEDI